MTKYRHKVFADRHLNRMEEIMRDVGADFETEPVESDAVLVGYLAVTGKDVPSTPRGSRA